MTLVLKVWARPLIVPHGPNTGGVKSSQMNLFIWLVLQLNRLPDPVMVKALSIFLYMVHVLQRHIFTDS